MNQTTKEDIIQDRDKKALKEHQPSIQINDSSDPRQLLDDLSLRHNCQWPMKKGYFVIVK